MVDEAQLSSECSEVDNGIDWFKSLRNILELSFHFVQKFLLFGKLGTILVDLSEHRE